MAKDMYEEMTVRQEPVIDAPKELAIVTHVLKHLDRNHAIKLLLSREIVHVADDHIDVLNRPLACLSHDEIALRNRV